MAEVINPPEYYFPGVNFNPAFYAQNAGGGGGDLTETLANTLYLRKTVPDTATAVETFNLGLQSVQIPASTSADNTVPNTKWVRDYFFSKSGNNTLTGINTFNNTIEVNRLETVTVDVPVVNAFITSTGEVNLASVASVVNIGTDTSAVSPIINLGTTSTVAKITGTLSLTAPIRSVYANPLVLPASNELGFYPGAIFNPTDPLLKPNNFTLSASTNASLAKINLTVGTWIITGSFNATSNATSGYVICAITPALDTFDDTTDAYTQLANNPGFNVNYIVSRIVQITADTSYYLLARVIIANQIVGFYKLNAVRIA